MFFVILLAFVPKIDVQAPSVKAAEAEGSLSENLNQLINNDPALKGALVGVSIRAASSGKILYSHNGDIRLRPASNMKLLTASVALSVLGKDHRFSTDILTDGSVKGKVLHGNVYLKGKGDPTLLKSDLDKLAVNLQEKGIQSVEGDLIGDDSWYDDVRLSVDLPWSDEYTYYGAQVSALTASPNMDYDTGTVIVDVKPGSEIGQEAVVNLTPGTEYVKVENLAVTVSPEGKKEIAIERDHGTNTITITGTIPVRASRSREWISVWEPTGYALELFQQSLAEKGIYLAGAIKTGVTPDNAKILSTHKSMPLSELLVPFMKQSNNGHAEVLIKEMGKKTLGEGSWEKGLRVMETELPKLGVETKTVVLRDGSGISHINLIPANEISNLLYSIQDETWFSPFVDSLPIAGVKEKMVGGTLRNRLKSPTTQGKVRAKTGSIATVSSLSGYIETKSGEALIFSILLNNLNVENKGKIIEDRIIEIIVNQ